jgi:polysaccharide chain length determinant protein (PEP-CTERM system associated)
MRAIQSFGGIAPLGELYGQLIALANSAWKRRWSALAIAWVVCVIGWAFVVSRPETYTASTRIFLDTATFLQPLLEGLAVERDVTTELEVMRQTLTTRANLEKVARLTDLDVLAATPAQMERLLDTIRSRTRVETDGRFLLTIKYQDTDPVRARDVVEAISRTFIENNLGSTREEIEAAQLFLDRQIELYERELVAAEQRLARFKEQRLSKLPDGENYRFRMEELRSQLEEAQANLKRAQARRSQLRRHLDDAPVSAGTMQIVEAEQELARLRSVYTEKHPEVIAARRKLEILRLQPPSQAVSSTSNPSAVADAGRQQASLELSLGEAEADVAAYSDQVSRLRERLARFEESAAQIPEAEAELSELNRDYDVIKIKHAELLGRREQAKISKDREEGTRRIDYEIVDPPRVPSLPDGPSRAILISAVFALSIAAGMGAAFLLSQVRPAFSDPMSLREAFGLAVLGTVSLVHSARQHSWHIAKLSTFATCSLLLIAAYGAVMTAETHVGWTKIVPKSAVEDLYGKLADLGELLPDALR